MQEVVKWFVKHGGVEVSPCCRITRSQLPNGGYGVYVDSEKLKRATDKAEHVLELLRIPKETSYSIKQLMEWVNSIPDPDETHFVRSQDALREHLGAWAENKEHMPFISETNLLVVYFCITMILLKKGYKFPQSLEVYLTRVLMKTKLSHPLSYIFMNDLDASICGHYRNSVQERFISSLLKFISSIFSSCERSIVLQIYCSVISRALEIPEEHKRGSDDFVVTSTLVPILDCVNHSNKHTNAFFDVDRSNDDILLLLDLKKCPQGKKEFEVFISYSKVEEMIHFKHIYGMLPRPEGQLQFWNFCISKSWLLRHRESSECKDVYAFYTKLQIVPYVQLVLLEDHVYINDVSRIFLELLLPFVPYNRILSSTKTGLHLSQLKLLAVLQKDSKAFDAKQTAANPHLDTHALAYQLFMSDQKYFKTALERFVAFLNSYLRHIIDKNNHIKAHLLDGKSGFNPLDEILYEELQISKKLKQSLKENKSFVSDQLDTRKTKFSACPPPFPCPAYEQTA